MMRPDEDERAARIGGARAEREDPKLVGAFNGSRVISSKFRFLISIKAEARFAGYITRDDCSAPVRGADPLRQKRAHAQRPASRADRRLDPRIWLHQPGADRRRGRHYRRPRPQTATAEVPLMKAKQRVPALRGGQPDDLASNRGSCDSNLPDDLASNRGSCDSNFVAARLDETENRAQQPGNLGNVGIN